MSVWTWGQTCQVLFWAEQPGSTVPHNLDGGQWERRKPFRKKKLFKTVEK